MLQLNLFPGGEALLELQPQGDASVPVCLPAADAELIAGLLTTAEVSAALARLFLAGVTAGERNYSGPAIPRRLTAPCAGSRAGAARSS